MGSVAFFQIKAVGISMLNRAAGITFQDSRFPDP